MQSRSNAFRVSRSIVLVAVMAVPMSLLACKEEAPPPTPGPRPVKMLAIGAAGNEASREYPGRIKAGQYSEIGFEVPGRVTEFVYEEGAIVKAGAKLATLDPRDYQARLDSAIAKERHARAERDRFKTMYEKDVKPYSEYELKLRYHQVQQANVREAQKALEDTVLEAPFEGIMARKLVEEYENVLAKQAVLIMQNDDLLEIKVNVPERDLAEGRSETVGNEELTGILKPRVQVSSIPDREFPARLKEIATVADPTTRTFEATFIFPKPEGVSILGGMTARVVISYPDERLRTGALVPATAVVSPGGDQNQVWVIDQESLTASARTVQLGELTGQKVEVISGLEEGDVIAISGVHQLREGMVVRRYER